MGKPTEEEQREAAAVCCPTLLARLVRFERAKRRRARRKRLMDEPEIRAIRRGIWEELFEEWFHKEGF